MRVRQPQKPFRFTLSLAEAAAWDCIWVELFSAGKPAPVRIRKKCYQDKTFDWKHMSQRPQWQRRALLLLLIRDELIKFNSTFRHRPVALVLEPTVIRTVSRLTSWFQTNATQVSPLLASNLHSKTTQFDFNVAQLTIIKRATNY